MTNSKVLVLGGNGFIGSHLVDKLLQFGHTVRVFDKKPEPYRKALHGVDYHIGEFGNRGLLSEALHGIEVVVHLISTTHPKTSNDDPVFDIKSNLIESLFLLEQCVSKSIKKIVFISSGGTVYGIPKKLPVAEEDQTNPICSYGISKLTIEKYLYLYKQLYNLDYTIIRPSNAYGPRQNPFGIQSAIPIFLGNIIRNKPVHIWGTGDVVRDYIYVDDLVNAIYYTVINNTASHIYNIGCGQGKSLNDLIILIKQIVGHDFAVTYKRSRVYDVPEIYLDITRASGELNWKQYVSIEQGIELTWNFIRYLYDDKLLLK